MISSGNGDGGFTVLDVWLVAKKGAARQSFAIMGSGVPVIMTMSGCLNIVRRLS